MNLSQVIIDIEIAVNPTAEIAITIPSVIFDVEMLVSITANIAITVPHIFLSVNSFTMIGSGGVETGGSAEVTTHIAGLNFTGSGGVVCGGAADISAGGHFSMVGSGGVETGGSSGVAIEKAFVGIGGAVCGGAATVTTFSPATFGTISTTLPLITSTGILVNDQINASLTTISSSITVIDNAVATITAGLPVVTASLSGGVYAIAAGLPLITSSATAYAGYSAVVIGDMPVIGTSISATSGYIATIAASLPLTQASISGYAGLTAEIDAQLPRSTCSITAFAGYAATIQGALPLIDAALTAGFGAIGTIDAQLPRITAALSILAQAEVQRLVMVVGTHTNVVTAYEQYPFNSFFELGGKYYGVGENGVCQIDVGDTDDGDPIAAGFSTGLMNMGEAYQKRIDAAYMTLRTAGDLMMTITVDEGAHLAPVELTLTAQQFVEFIQRRLLIPRGLRGKTWQFELNNVDGCDFDFGQLGLNIAVSARRI